jgi:predicted RNase H-like HicB family nuclease
MPSSDPPRPDDPALSGDALKRLEERLDRASEAAERLIAEAAAEAGRVRKPPPAGWQAPAGDGAAEGELELLAQLIQQLRDLVPPELQRRLGEALRELLLALRALIDFYLERMERRSEPPPAMEDIPIE